WRVSPPRGNLVSVTEHVRQTALPRERVCHQVEPAVGRAGTPPAGLFDLASPGRCQVEVCLIDDPDHAPVAVPLELRPEQLLVEQAVLTEELVAAGWRLRVQVDDAASREEG